MVPMGFPVIIHSKPYNHKSWDFRGRKGFSIGPDLNTTTDSISSTESQNHSSYPIQLSFSMTTLLNYVQVPIQRTAPDRANIASALARRQMLGPPTNDADQADATSPPTSESPINVNKLVVTNSPLHQLFHH